MIGIVDGGQVFAGIIFGARKAAEMGRHGFKVENLDRAFVAGFAEFVPHMVERHALHLIAIIAKGVDIAVADLAPVDELDSQFETALDSGHHFALVNFEQAIEIQEGRNRGFTNADGADHFRFDQGNRDVATCAKL